MGSYKLGSGGRFSTPTLSYSLITSSQGFLEAEDSWNDLYDASPRCTPFQSWAWLYSWWEHYSEGRELRIIAVSDPDDRQKLVAIFPFMLENRKGFRRLLFIGNGPSSYLDVLVRKGWEDAVGKETEDLLKNIPDWHVADLQQIRPESAVWNLTRNWKGLSAKVWQSDCVVLKVTDWEEMLMRLSKNQRSASRKTIRRAGEDGLEHRLAETDDSEEAARRLVAVNRDHWLERKEETSPDHWSDRFEAHIVDVARRMTENRIGAVSEVWRDGEVITSQLLLFWEGMVGDYMAGSRRSVLSRYSFNTLYIYYASEIARKRGVEHLSLLKGREAYKYRWKPEILPNHRLILGHSKASWFPYMLYCRVRSRLDDLATSEDGPDWIKKSMERFDSMRLKRAWKRHTES